MSVPLDIFADPVCPWCLIGKAELDRALESRPDHPFVVTWHPFRLNPDMPKSGMAHTTYMLARFKDEKGIIEANRPVLEAAERLGLWLNMAAIERIPDTTDAHRLMLWARIEGAQTRVMSGMMAAHWREGRNIGRADVLAQIADAAGMDGTVIERLLATDADRDTVLAAEIHARERGVSAVPTFIVANSHVVPGAQPASLWQSVIDELAGEDG
ncbi:DsbA family oxidoreductase [Paracoccus sp. Z118]|uniref:DsbA family oxidoreductase n=1 Tax=Paracoccus sp. Z118 TaxID=2851017 RepID=UPI001C2BFE89|nr:DsbA family oxidoreductase [Paracoccus sp. Z118]MBV0892290.1 DsbA family oxidoreductase [Paracoccus sp. Z118]